MTPGERYWQRLAAQFPDRALPADAVAEGSLVNVRDVVGESLWNSRDGLQGFITGYALGSGLADDADHDTVRILMDRFHQLAGVNA